MLLRSKGKNKVEVRVLYKKTPKKNAHFTFKQSVHLKIIYKIFL